MQGIRNKTSAEHYTWGAGCDGWRLLNRPDFAVTEERIPPGLGEVLHYHSFARQLFFILEGELKIEVDGATAHLKKGDTLEIEPMQRHLVTNTSDTDAHFLVISAPSTVNDRVNLANE